MGSLRSRNVCWVAGETQGEGHTPEAPSWLQ